MTDKPTASDAEENAGWLQQLIDLRINLSFTSAGAIVEWAIDRINRLSSTEGEMQVTLEEYRVALIELEDRGGEMRKALEEIAAFKASPDQMQPYEEIAVFAKRLARAALATTPSPAGEREKALREAVLQVEVIIDTYTLTDADVELLNAAIAAIRALSHPKE